MAVWKSVFLHEFLDGDPANLVAVPGELTVLPDGPVIEPTPEPSDRGLLMAPGNRLLSYRFQEPFDDVIGVDLSFDLLYPEPNPFTPVVVPLVSLGAGAVIFVLGRLETPFPELPPGSISARVVLEVDGNGMEFDRVALPPFAALRTTRFRVRWHTHGQAHIWHEGVLRAYEPGLAAGRSLAVDQLVVGIPSDTPRFFPRYRVRRVFLKLLRRDDARHEIDRHVPLDVSYPPPNQCAERVRVLHEELHSRTRLFMAGIVSQLTTSWREGQTQGPFSPESVAAHAAAVGAAESFGAFLDTREDAAADTFLQRIEEFFDILAAADPAGFAELITDLAYRAEALDPACRRALEPVYAANAEALQPLARLLQATWQLAQTARPGGSNA